MILRLCFFSNVQLHEGMFDWMNKSHAKFHWVRAIDQCIALFEFNEAARCFLQPTEVFKPTFY